MIDSWVHQGETVAQSTKTVTGRSRESHRFETSGADLHDTSHWLVGDFNGDGWSDFRYVKTLLPHCKYWWTYLWNPAKETFDLAPKIAHSTTLDNRPLGRTCL